MKVQRLPSESSIQHATPVRQTTVENLNFKSTDHAFANSGLKADFVARFQGYQPLFAQFFYLFTLLFHSGLSTSLHPGSGRLNLKATTVRGCSSITPMYIIPIAAGAVLICITGCKQRWPAWHGEKIRQQNFTCWPACEFFRDFVDAYLATTSKNC
jgi:hypothetical protein